MADLLGTTLSWDMRASSNLYGEGPGATWRFLLPSLEVGTILWLGSPTPAALATLSHSAKQLNVVCPSARALSSTTALLEGGQYPNVRAELLSDPRALPIENSSVDLVVVLGKAAPRLRAGAALFEEVKRVLTPQGSLYIEPSFARQRSAIADARLLGAARILTLAPSFGELCRAAVTHQGAAAQFIDGQAKAAIPGRSRLKATIRPLMQNPKQLRPPLKRLAAVVDVAGKSSAPMSLSPPRYLCAIAHSAGVDITNHTWGVAFGGGYGSRKLVFYLFRPNGDAPEYVVKLTRDSRYNSRLANEWKALSILSELPGADPAVVPTPSFFGEHGGVAILGQTTVEGTSFRARTNGSADCMFINSAVNWLLKLNQQTAESDSVTPVAAAGRLFELLDRTVATYSLPADHVEFLRELISSLANSQKRFPVVFQHGDPGIWNLLATTDGRAAFLDWEAWESKGMPLWDLLYLLRSVGVWSGRQNGIKNPLEAFRRYYLEQSDLGDLLATATTTACQQADIPLDLVELLFYTCWMHRALKEANRLPRERLQKGHYVNLLQMCIEHRNAPGLQRLFGEEPTVSQTRSQKVSHD